PRRGPAPPARWRSRRDAGGRSPAIGAPEPPEERGHRGAGGGDADDDELDHGLAEAALDGDGGAAAEDERGQAVLGHLVAGAELRVLLARHEGVAAQRRLEVGDVAV